MVLFVHILQLSLHRLWLDLYFEDRLAVDVVVLTHHLVVDDTEGGRVVAGFVASLPPESRVRDSVVEARGFIWTFQLIVGVGEAVTVRGQPQSQLVLRDRQLD